MTGSKSFNSKVHHLSRLSGPSCPVSFSCPSTSHLHCPALCSSAGPSPPGGTLLLESRKLSVYIHDATKSSRVNCTDGRSNECVRAEPCTATSLGCISHAKTTQHKHIYVPSEIVQKMALRSINEWPYASHPPLLQHGKLTASKHKPSK